MDAITITYEVKPEEGFEGLRISQGDKYADGLGYDEALGLIAMLIIPMEKQTPCIHWMKTSAQHKLWRDTMDIIGDRFEVVAKKSEEKIF